MARIQLKNIVKSWGESVGVKRMSLDIADGEFLVLLGPSGCGKTTTMRMVAGLEDPTEGEIWIGDTCVNNLEPKDRDVAMVFQSYGLYPNMTVYENISFPLRIRGTPTADIRPAVMKASGQVELDDFLDRRPKELSGGQRQRVALARAIVRQPKVFLMDEPLSNLDAKLRVAMRSEIKELHQRLKTTSIYVTHDQIEAMTMGDKIVVMKDGRIEQMGSPLELYDRPANVFVAGFIGSPSMNFVPATLRRDAAGARLELADGSRLAAPAHAGGIDGQSVVLGTRPEHLKLATEGGIASRVVVMEPTGADTFVSCRHGPTEMAAVFRERHDFTPGSTIHLLPDLDRAHLFDASSGQRLAA